MASGSLVKNVTAIRRVTFAMKGGIAYKNAPAARVFISEQLGKWNGSKMEWPAGMGNIMPNDSHQRAVEFHELAAHAHRAAAAHHGKEDHQTRHEHSKQAMEHANKAMQWSQEAHGKSVKSAGKS